MANKVVRIVLIIVLFIVFFELGLFGSYTIVTSEAPNIQGLIGMQVSKISSFFSPEDTDNKEFNVTIEALGYASPNSTSGQIVISQTPSYKIIANGVASYKGTGLMVDKDTVTINSVLKLY